ncbi:MAG: bifunctional phosphoglucose/phosphomannose isomerase [Candidatus Thermoplasmatota archaeon]|jgi:glucose/mannose-6-phosphate isomerase|nr:bifunctional phosphoglucose/phosphomannose isomerase [Candidatus Thermoplasmatota archaeon]
MDFLDELRSLKDQFKFKGKFDLHISDFTRIVYVGMGGSAIAGRIFSEIFDEKEFLVLGDGSLPQYLGKESLLIAGSYSGSTEETLSAVKQAKSRNMTVFGLGTGGPLEKLCDQWVSIPAGFQPRSSIGFFITALARTFLRETKDLEEASRVVEGLDSNSKFLSKIVDRIFSGKKTPVVYSFLPYSSVAYRWRTQFNENAKVIAMSHVFPELDHNEIVGLWKTYGKENLFFIVAGKPEDKRLEKRISVTMEMTNTEYTIVEQRGESLLARAMYLVHCGDYLSYYLALRRKIDPEDVSIITELKRSLA